MSLLSLSLDSQDLCSVDPFLLLPIDPVEPLAASPDPLLSLSYLGLDLDSGVCCCLPLMPDPAVRLPPPDGSMLDLVCSPAACSPPSPSLPDVSPAADKRRWDDAARKKHSSACAGKSRLSLQDKLDIVCLYYSAPSSPSRCRRSMRQRDIARMYGKSRAAISKLLKPEYAREIMGAREGLLVKDRAEVMSSIKEEERQKELPRLGLCASTGGRGRRGWQGGAASRM